MDSLVEKLSQIAKPNIHSKVYKDECVFSYDTPETSTGLYVSLTSFLGFGKDYVDGYVKKTGNAVFLHIRREKREIKSDGSATIDGPEKKITRLAIGVEGGYDPEAGKQKYEFEDFYSIVVAVFPSWQIIPYPNGDLPQSVVECVKAVLAADSATAKMESESMAGTWDGEARVISKYATDLKQLDNGKKIPPSGWKCEECDLTNNLWLNLTDGSILCGRRFFDGSGGNDHAVKHYQECRYPLAVKLGTITADGKGDVYSYVEDDMVEDPNLIVHLAHFGIKTTQLEKTEKSMVELEIDLNQRIGEWSILTESSSKLEPISGPGYTGMKNLGNSCYLNSVMQVMFIIPDFVKRFAEKSDDIFATYPADPANDFNIQMAKLAVGLLGGKYSQVVDNTLDTDSVGISPVMFKNLIGRNHPDFSTKQQQDAQEFFLHIMDTLKRNSRHHALNPADSLKFTVEDRFECTSSGKVKYTNRDEYCLPLSIPLHLASNLPEVKAYEARLKEAESKGERLEPDALVRPRISLQDCLEVFAQTESVEQFYSSAINAKTIAKKNTRLATMPEYLLLQLKKFTLREDWTSIKLDVAVDIPDTMDLNNLRATGLLPHEELLPELSAPVPAPIMDAAVLQQLAEMGFHPEACKRAVFFTQNSGMERATQWIMEHIGDADFNEPFVPPGTDGGVGKPAAAAFVPSPDGLNMLQAMGFTAQQATKGLKETDNSVERAADWLFSHQSELDAMDFEDVSVAQPLELTASSNPSVASTNTTASPAFTPSSAGIVMLEQMGFTQSQATKALKQTDNDIERAADWLFSHQSELDAMEVEDVHVEEVPSVAAPVAVNPSNASSKYKLVAFISHMGTSSQVGHYVCHILKDEKWVIFNDSKVAISQNPPKELGYLYLYQRV